MSKNRLDYSKYKNPGRKWLSDAVWNAQVQAGIKEWERKTGKKWKNPKGLPKPLP